MSNVVISPSSDDIPNIIKFHDNVLSSTFRCLMLVEKPSVFTHQKWASVYHDTRYLTTYLSDIHDTLVAHLATLQLYKMFSKYFSYEPLPYSSILDVCLDNIELELYDLDVRCLVREVIRHFENMDKIYASDIQEAIGNNNFLIASLEALDIAHIENVTFSSQDILFSFSL